jgi:hypothetical protein
MVIVFWWKICPVGPQWTATPAALSCVTAPWFTCWP